MRIKILSKIFFIALFLVCALTNKAHASLTQGSIDAQYKYAWSSKSGWINFGCTNCNLQITDSVLTGYAWSQNFGWINLNPTQGGVHNNGNGTLSGYAWAEKLGWINFTGTVINSSGKFTGTATNNSIGTINFDCADCEVRTDWRPQSARPACNNGLDDDGDGFIDFPADSGCASISSTSEVNQGVVFLFSPVIHTNDVPVPTEDKKDQPKVVEKEKPIDTWNNFKEKAKDIIAEIFNPIPIDLIFPNFKKSSVAVQKDLLRKELASKPLPDSLNKLWLLLPRKPINEFVLAPLPKDINNLAQKFPELQNTFNSIGIKKITDLTKLNSVKLALPGVSERASYGNTLRPASINSINGIPLAKLSLEMKQALPKEVVFAKSGKELIDFNILLSVNSQGKSEQTIRTIAKHPIELSVKPGAPVNGVTGYLVLKPKGTQKLSKNNLIFSLKQLAASALFAMPKVAENVTSKTIVEEKMVLQQFSYSDTDGDGIYTATINAPAVDGEYEVITVLEFTDPDLGRKEIRLVTVVDPEGYVYASISRGELRIANAVVTLMWLNPQTKTYEMWQAKEYSQENPQITDDTGKYSFLVPPGKYYLKVEHPSYHIYQSEIFDVNEGSGIHMNIKLRSNYALSEWLDWKTIIIIMLGLLLFYNFYHDRMLERIIRNRLSNKNNQ